MSNDDQSQSGSEQEQGSTQFEPERVVQSEPTAESPNRESVVPAGDVDAGDVSLGGPDDATGDATGAPVESGDAG